ncbi:MULTISPECIES: hypothetical protein [unclassified Minwuia]|uniref:hypothetical protein n=1 Tax=unclassified Minwuia TaxID=2618799 RepID=UPI00247A7922|nr:MULTISPECIES: hypothetical protein [unclassified Minwuia]
MNFPVWTKPGIYGAIVGGVIVSIVGFSAGGWMTGSKANEMAHSMAADQVVAALVPVCHNTAAADPDREAKVLTISQSVGYSRYKAVMEAGWATPPGSDSPDVNLARACVEGLNLDAS